MGTDRLTVHNHSSCPKPLLLRTRRLPPVRPSLSTSWPTTRSTLPRLPFVFVWLLRRWLLLRNWLLPLLLARRVLDPTSFPQRSQRLRSPRQLRSQQLRRLQRNQLPRSLLLRNLLLRRLPSQRRHKLYKAILPESIWSFSGP